MKFLLTYLGTVAAVFLTVTLVPGIEVDSWITTLFVALAWSVIAFVIRPILSILTLPITLITFGLFAFILNALLFWAMTLIVPGFSVSGFWIAVLGVIVLSLLNWLIQKIL